MPVPITAAPAIGRLRTLRTEVGAVAVVKAHVSVQNHCVEVLRGCHNDGHSEGTHRRAAGSALTKQATRAV